MPLTLTCAHESRAIATQRQRNPTHETVRKQRVLEVNPQPPLIQGLLNRVKELSSPEDLEDPDLEAPSVRSSSEIANTNVCVFLVFACAVCTNFTGLTTSLNGSTVLSVALLVCPRRCKHP